jgi:hypothetical protein
VNSVAIARASCRGFVLCCGELGADAVHGADQPFRFAVLEQRPFPRPDMEEVREVAFVFGF